MGLVGEASPVKWGRLHNSESLEWAMCILCNEVCNAYLLQRAETGGLEDIEGLVKFTVGRHENDQAVSAAR